MKNRGKVERRNRRRMEVIANWMHSRSVGEEEQQRAVVPYDDLKDFLIDHISKNERIPRDEEPEDLADTFIEFVKKRAGLLIEVGDNQYSFIHLTFQEYLTSSHIITAGEKGGAADIWKRIEKYCTDARWREVIRLMIAGLKSDESQEYLIDKIISENRENNNHARSQLLGGFILDGIDPAEERKEDIYRHLFLSSGRAENLEVFKPGISILRSCLAKDRENDETMKIAYRALWKASDDNNMRTALLLNAVSLNWDQSIILKESGGFFNTPDPGSSLLKLFFAFPSNNEAFELLSERFEMFWEVKKYLSLTSFTGNFLTASYEAVSSALDTKARLKQAFQSQLVATCGQIYSGPFLDYIFNGLCICSPNIKWLKINDLALVRDRDRARDRAISKQVDLWQVILSSSDYYNPLIELLCDIFELEPRPQWMEALRVEFLPQIPKRITLYNESFWQETESAFERGEFDEAEIYGAAFLLIFDSWLYIFELYKTVDDSIFDNLAELTKKIDAPPLKTAHCIRDLAYGDESRTEDLAAMVKSDDPEYREIFETCLWRLTPEEEEKLKNEKKR